MYVYISIYIYVYIFMYVYIYIYDKMSGEGYRGTAVQDQESVEYSWPPKPARPTLKNREGGVGRGKEGRGEY